MSENAATSSNTENANICVHCGLCCDGSLFGKTGIDEDDDMAFLNELGVEIVEEQNRRFFLQPCIWLTGKACSLYHENRRFKACKSFQCRLLKKYLAKEISCDAALGIIGDVQKRRQSLMQLVEELAPSSDRMILSFIRELRQSGRLEDLSFRKTYATQILDCMTLQELLKRRFYKE